LNDLREPTHKSSIMTHVSTGKGQLDITRLDTDGRSVRVVDTGGPDIDASDNNGRVW